MHVWNWVCCESCWVEFVSVLCGRRKGWILMGVSRFLWKKLNFEFGFCGFCLGPVLCFVEVERVESFALYCVGL